MRSPRLRLWSLLSLAILTGIGGAAGGQDDGRDRTGGANAPAAGLRVRYQPTPGGYCIVGGQDAFNRTLYGGHAQDDLENRYYTLAGDQPIVMGAIIHTEGGGSNAKCGTLMLGVSQSYGVDSPENKYGVPSFGAWFHECRDNVAIFRNGWWEYHVEPPLIYSASVTAFVEVLPLAPEDGFLVHVRLTPQSQTIFCVGFGGVTDYLGLLTNPGNKQREFTPEHCRGNVIVCGKNRALLEGPKSKMWIGASFATDVSVGDAAEAVRSPGRFLARGETKTDFPMVRMSCPVPGGQSLDGVIVVLRNQEEQALDAWLARKDPVGDLKQEIARKHDAILVQTPEPMLDLTIPANVVGMDACWNKSVFCHGATNWHSPYLGWRVCYGPTVLGWHDRAVGHFLTHAAGFVEDKQHGDGYIPGYLHGGGFGYNMQEVAIDMLLYDLEWTGDLEVAGKTFDRIAQALDFESRVLDPDRNGLYQNHLNTWISDGHPYNGGDCAQASAYNYRANRVMAVLAAKLGRDPKPFEARAEKIKHAVRETLWLSERGVLAEYRDTIGNKLVHPSPELATIYHAIECGLVDPFQAYQMLRFTRTDLRSERTVPRAGRLAWSSNWYPRNYSSCGLYPGENIHLAWAYFHNGQANEGADILRGIVDGHFMGSAPGSVAHNLNGTGMSDGSFDFADTVSMYLRLVVEGLFGIRLQLLEDRIQVAPCFPPDWDRANLRTKDAALAYRRQGNEEQLEFTCQQPGLRVLRLPMRATNVTSVTLDGQPVRHRVEPRIGRSDVVVETPKTGTLRLCVVHGEGRLPTLAGTSEVRTGEKLTLRANTGAVAEVEDPSGALKDISVQDQVVEGHCVGTPGPHTVFVRVRSEQWDGWLPADFVVAAPTRPKLPEPEGAFQPVDITKSYNIALAEIHKRDYASPRPVGLALMSNRNGRYVWDDNNQGGPRTTRVDDTRLRGCGGVFKTPGGIPFRTPAEGPNAACASVWDNFPDEIAIPLEGKGTEMAVLLVGVTNPMQTWVENGRLTVRYRDGSQEVALLVNPVNFDDWLVAATQRENETVYFSDYNHAFVQRIRLDPAKEIESLSVRGTANEVIVGVLGVSLRREPR